MVALPDRVGKYFVLERIAQGGMAEVYKAKSVGIAGFEKILALKRILPHHAREPRFIRSFVDEARIAVSLNHRNIVQVFDFGKASGELFLAMELIEGVDLRSAIATAAGRDIELPIALSCYILSDLGAGLDYAHRKTDAQGRSLGIVHCDVSPQNVMLSYEGFVKVLDFGVARASFSAAPREKRLRGKPRYMAPEQTRGEETSPATDVFALGIMAWELLTGLPLFGGDDMSAILDSVRTKVAPEVISLNPDVPPDLSRAIATALSKDPAERGSAADLSGALAHAARELATVASSRALSEWLERVFPEAYEPPLDEPTSPTADITLGTKMAEAAETGLRTEDSPLTFEDEGSEDSIDPLDPGADEPGEGEPGDTAQALLEKRRAVASAVLLDGGEPATRRELCRILADLAYKRGAVVQARTDDSLVALFGLEVAGEDDVASAMHYALDAIELARESAQGSDLMHADLAVRIAARAGIVARLHDGAVRIRRDAIEETLELAGEAEPSRPLLTGGTGRIASAHFAFRELPARRQRRRRLRVLELLGPRDFDDRARALHQRRGRFVGRAQELRRLSARLELALAEARRVTVALIGEPGVGKSRIIAEFVARARALPEPPPLVAVAAGPGSREAPFGLVTDFFQAALRLPPGRGERARGRLAQRLRGALENAGLERGDVDECVASVELAMELRDGALTNPVQASADLRERLGGALRSFRRALLRDRFSILVVENLHDADGATAEVLRFALAPPPPEGAQLVILTSRPLEGALPPDLDEIIRIDELEDDERLTLIGDRLGAAATEEIVTAVGRRAGGNPLFIEELCTAVRERGPSDIPSSARDVIASRVDRLPGQTKAVLQHAAVLGPTFRTRILEELVGPQVHAHLEELTEEGLLVAADSAAEASEGEHAFRHGLIQEVVYESLAAPARKTTHARLGQLLALRSEAGAEEPPAVVARHLELGGLRAAAPVFWLRAGKVALAASDAAGARDAFTRALELSGGETRGARWREEALLGREQAYRQLGDHDAEARDLAELEALSAGDDRLRAEVESRSAERLLRLGEYQQAVEASERAEKAAAAAGDERVRGEALRVRAEVYERTGQFDQGLEVVDRAIAIFRRVGAHYEETRAMISIGRNHLMRSRYEAARRAYQPVLERLEGSADPWLERVVQNHVAVIHLCLGEFEEAMKSARRSLEICQHYGDNARVGDNFSVCGIILAAVGQYREARGWFQRGLEFLDATRSRWSRADCLVYAGANEAALGEYERALAYIEESMELAREIGARYVEVNGGVALAGALLRRGRPGDLERAAEISAHAVETARASTLVGGEIQALSRQAEAWRRTGAGRGALGLSWRAIELLDEQQYLEGSEEEIVYVHSLLLRAHGDPEQAAAYLRRAQRGLEHKLGLLSSPEWRRSFAEDVATNAAILRA